MHIWKKFSALILRKAAEKQHNLCSARMADASGLGDPCEKCTNNACDYRKWSKSNQSE